MDKKKYKLILEDFDVQYIGSKTENIKRSVSQDLITSVSCSQSIPVPCRLHNFYFIEKKRVLENMFKLVIATGHGHVRANSSGPGYKGPGSKQHC